MEKANNHDSQLNGNSQKETTSCSDNSIIISQSDKHFLDIFGKKRFVPKKDYSAHQIYTLHEPLDEIYIEQLLGELEYLKQEKNNLEYIKDHEKRVFQPHIKSSFRSILLDWMMELCSQLNFKRITFHLAVKLVDLYIWKNSIEPNKLQLLGVTSIFLSSKMEEISPKSVSQLAFTTGDAYTKHEILDFEKKMLNTFKWKINFQTCLTWTNYITSKWDSWLFYQIQNNPNLCILPYFRNRTNNLNYFPLLNFYHCLDLSSLLTESVDYDEKIFPACLLYLIIGFYSNIIPYNTVISIANGNMDFSVLSYSGLNTYIDMFLSDTIDLQLMEIVTYMCRGCKLLIYVLTRHIKNPDDSKVSFF